MVGASGIAAFVSVPVAAAVFAILYGICGAVDLSFGAVLEAMVGVHALVGNGEELITAAERPAGRPAFGPGPRRSARSPQVPIPA